MENAHVVEGVKCISCLMEIDIRESGNKSGSVYISILTEVAGSRKENIRTKGK